MKLKRVVEKRIVVRVGESIKQSLNYQSAEATYSVEIPVATEAEIPGAIKRAEKQVEHALGIKMKEQQRLLKAMPH
jgi:hypothetical protein